MPVIRISSEQERALKLLASSRHGISEQMLARSLGFSSGVLASLVRRRLVAAREREMVMAGGKMIEVMRLRITGRRAVEGEGWCTCSACVGYAAFASKRLR